VYESLKNAIVEGELRPGQRLKELEVAKQLGASRTPVRGAFSRLEQEGLVCPLRSGGLIVVEFSEQDVLEIFGLIRVLESYAAWLAAEKITPKQIDQLEAICNRAEQFTETGGDRFNDQSRRFHSLLVEIAGHKRLQDLIVNLRVVMQPYRVISLNLVELRRSSVRDHRRMIETLRAHDAWPLERLMSEHLDAAQSIALTAIREQAQRLAAAT
jgi:DNA-binding GntR family transcriptional regulator